MKQSVLSKLLLMLCILLFITAGCGSKDSPSLLPTKKPTDSTPAASSASVPLPSETESVPASSAPEPAVLFEQNMREIMSDLPEHSSSGDTAGSSLDAAILNKTDWKIVSQQENTLEITVSSPDMQALLQNQLAELLSQPDGISQILSLLEGKDIPMREVTVSVTLDENGVPTDAYSLTDALYGGLLSLLEEIYASMEASK